MKHSKLYILLLISILAISKPFGGMLISKTLSCATVDAMQTQKNGAQYQLNLDGNPHFPTQHVQFAYRDLKVCTDKAGYLGMNVTLGTLKAESYAAEVSVNAYIGYQHHVGLKGNLVFKGVMNLNSGVKLAGNLAFGTQKQV